MAAQPPQPRFESESCTGVLYENLVGPAVGPTNLSDCNNLIYHRQNGWGKRPGAVRTALPAGPAPNQHLVSGVRWYRTYPTVETRLVVWAQGQLLIGTDADDLAPVPGTGSFTNPHHRIAPDFCSARDPQARQGQGADILIIAGLHNPTGSFGRGAITITGLPSSAITGTVSVTLTDANGNAVTTSNYHILPTDNPASIADQLSTMINETYAYLYSDSVSYSPFIGEAYYTAPVPKQTPGADNNTNQQAIVHLGARVWGAAGNNITYTVTLALSTTDGSAVGLTFYVGSPPNEVTVPDSGSQTVNFAGGGNPFSGPMKLGLDDGVRVDGLSYMAPNDWTGCCTWHDHCWFWADTDNADTVFASDIYQPEAFTFMAQNGGLTGSQNGGYNIGPGDGDPGVKNLTPNGNVLGVFKTANVYAISGYDFQSGEYQFSVSPFVVGYGCPSRDCVDVLEGQWVFWSGRKFLRLAVGAFEPEHIGLPIPLSEGRAASWDQSTVKVAAGDFQAKTLLNNEYTPGAATEASVPVLFRSIALFSIGHTQQGPFTTFVYDDEKSALSSAYAWSKWTAWSVGCWIKYGIGENPQKTGTDPPTFHFIDPAGTFFYNAGADAIADWSNAIAWMAQTGWTDFGTPEMIKNIHEFYLRVSATAGALFTCACIPARIVLPQAQLTQFNPQPISFAYVATYGPQTGPNGEALNDLKQFIQSALQTQAVIFRFTENGESMAGFELSSYGVDINPQEGYAT